MAKAKPTTLKVLGDGGTIVEELSFDNPNKFRLFYITREGHLRILGKLPWKRLRKPLRKWLTDWATKQDMVAFRATLQERLPGMSVESLLDGVWQTSDRAKAYFQQECGNREGQVAFRMLLEILEALSRQLSERAIQWEVESLPNNGGIYRILLEGGGGEESFRDNQG